MFLLEESLLPKVMGVYAAFWVVAIVGLYFVVGLLMKKAERITEKSHHEAGKGH